MQLPHTDAPTGAIPNLGSDYLQLVPSGNPQKPWGMARFNASGNELRFNPLSHSWVDSSDPTFLTDYQWSDAGQIYGLYADGYLYVSNQGQGTFISLSTQYSIGGTTTYTPVAAQNTCVNYYAMANDAAVSASASLFNGALTVDLGGLTASTTAYTTHTVTVTAPQVATGSYTETLYSTGYLSNDSTKPSALEALSASVSTPGFVVLYQDPSGAWSRTFSLVNGINAIKAVGQITSDGTTPRPVLTIRVRTRKVTCPGAYYMKYGYMTPGTYTSSLANSAMVVYAGDPTVFQTSSQTDSIGSVNGAVTFAACETTPTNPITSGATDTANGMTLTLADSTNTGGAPLSDMTYNMFVTFRAWTSNTTQTLLSNQPVTTGTIYLSDWVNAQQGGFYCVFFDAQNSHGPSFSRAMYNNHSNWTCRDHALAPTKPVISSVIALANKTTGAGTVKVSYSAPYNGLATTYTVDVNAGANQVLVNASGTGINGATTVSATSGLAGTVTVRVTACNNLGCVSSDWSNPATVRKA